MTSDPSTTREPERDPIVATLWVNFRAGGEGVHEGGMTVEFWQRVRDFAETRIREMAQ